MFTLKVYLINLGISILGSVIGGFWVAKQKKGNLWVRTSIVFLIIIFLVTLVVTYIYTDHNKKNQLLAKYRADFLVLRTDFENLSYYTIDSLQSNSTDYLIFQELSEEIPSLITKIELIYDNELDEGYVILKYDLLCYLEAMYGELIGDVEQKLVQINKGLHYNNLAFKTIDLIKNKQADDDYYRSVIEWLQADFASDRLTILKAWLKAEQYRLDGISEIECNEIKNMLIEINESYLRRNPLRKNPSLKFFLECN